MIFVILLLIFILSVIITRIITTGIASSLIFSVEEVPQSRVAVVFGAGLQRDGTPTTVLRDRVTTAVELYHFGKVQKLLMSGDNRFLDYNEPASMREYAINLGVPTEDIVLDYAGRRTYDTCYRALHIFNVKDVILVTQDFHLPRALYICNVLGLNAWGLKPIFAVIPATRCSSGTCARWLPTLPPFWTCMFSIPSLFWVPRNPSSRMKPPPPQTFYITDV